MRCTAGRTAAYGSRECTYQKCLHRGHNPRGHNILAGLSAYDKILRTSTRSIGRSSLMTRADDRSVRTRFRARNRCEYVQCYLRRVPNHSPPFFFLSREVGEGGRPPLFGTRRSIIRRKGKGPGFFFSSKMEVSIKPIRFNPAVVDRELHPVREM